MNVIVGMASVARFVLQSEAKETANLQCDEKQGIMQSCLIVWKR